MYINIVIKMAKKQSGLVKSKGFQVFVGIVMALFLLGLFNLGVRAVYEAPNYSDYCDNTYYSYTKPVIDSTTINDTYYQEQIAYYNECNDVYQKDLNSYNKVIFYIFVNVGLIASVIGLFIMLPIFQFTVFGAGIFFIIEGIWRNLNDKLPAFVAGVIAFIITSYFIYKQFYGKSKRK